MSKLKEYICIKELFLERYDDDGFFCENEYIYINVGEVFQRSEEPFRVVGDKDSIRLDSDTKWLEINEEKLNKHFRERVDDSE